MKLIMTGLDHKRADLAVREKFALTREKAQGLLADIVGREAVSGCVIISTCNRTELYASVYNDSEIQPTELLCLAMGRDYQEFEEYFTERKGVHVIQHLYRVAAGLDSQIMGDDQIITQAREALELSRGCHCSDSYLETLFRMAVHTGKIIKTDVIIKAHANNSVPDETLAKLKKSCTLPGKEAVVIGNGRIGRMVSDLLVAEGVHVVVTLREFKKGDILVPEGADTVAYSDRYAAIEAADIVVSATTSPHYTLFAEDFAQLAAKPRIAVDLAVPRDIEPSIQDIEGITLYTIDDISGNGRALPAKSMSQIKAIIVEQTMKYGNWFDFKEAHQGGGGQAGSAPASGAPAVGTQTTGAPTDTSPQEAQRGISA